MAPPKRLTRSALIERLNREGHRYEFFQLIRLLENFHAPRVRLGQQGPPTREAVRLSHDPRLVFHTSGVVNVNIRDEADESGELRSRIETGFFGLTGTNSPLPLHMTEEVLEAESDDDPTLRAFFDLFHHRLLSLLYRAMGKYRAGVFFQAQGGDPYTKRLASFVGSDASNSDAVGSRLSPMRLLGLSAILAQRSRTSFGLEYCLKRLLPDVDMQLHTFLMRRVPVPMDQRAVIGVRNNRLGLDLTAGATVADRSSTFRLTLGPVRKATYDDLMPGGRRFHLVRLILSEFSRGLLDVEVEVELAAGDVPVFQLGGDTSLGRTSRLPSKELASVRSRFTIKGSGDLTVPQLVQ